MLMSSSDRPAMLFYQANGFRVLSAGSFVLCAVSGERIELEVLRNALTAAAADMDVTMWRTSRSTIDRKSVV